MKTIITRFKDVRIGQHFMYNGREYVKWPNSGAWGNLECARLAEHVKDGALIGFNASTRVRPVAARSNELCEIDNGTRVEAHGSQREWRGVVTLGGIPVLCGIDSFPTARMARNFARELQLAMILDAQDAVTAWENWQAQEARFEAPVGTSE